MLDFGLLLVRELAELTVKGLIMAFLFLFGLLLLLLGLLLLLDLTVWVLLRPEINFGGAKLWVLLIVVKRV